MPRRSKKVSVTANQLRALRKKTNTAKPVSSSKQTPSARPTRQQITVQVPKDIDTKALQQRIAQLIASGDFHLEKKHVKLVATPVERAETYQNSTTRAAPKQVVPPTPTPKSNGLKAFDQRSNSVLTMARY
jgi:hypothetical protein